VPNSDPFEVSKVKVPKLNTGLSGAQKAGQYARRAGRGAKNAAYNKTSKPAGGMFRSKSQPVDDKDRPLYGVKYAEHDAAGGRYMRGPNGKKFGQKGARPQGSNMANFAAGSAIGTVAGSLAGDARYGGQTRHDYRTNRKVNKAFKMPKRPTLITNVGTASNKRPGLRPGIIAGTAVGSGTLSYTGYKMQQKDMRKEIDRTYRKQKKTQVSKAGTLERYNSTRADRNKLRAKDAANVGGQTAAATLGGISAVKFMSGHKPRPGKKAFIAAGAAGAATAAGAFAGKYDKKQYRVKKDGSTTVAKDNGRPSGGRYAAGWAFPGLHGAVAGKKGKKLAAAGSELGHTAGGSLGGAAIGAAVSRGKLTSLGAAAGSTAGSLQGVKASQRKGRYKVEKNDTTSAFGVDHGY